MPPVKQVVILYYQENGQVLTIANVNDRHDALGILRRDNFGGTYVQRIVVRQNSG